MYFFSNYVYYFFLITNNLLPFLLENLFLVDNVSISSNLKPIWVAMSNQSFRSFILLVSSRFTK